MGTPICQLSQLSGSRFHQVPHQSFWRRIWLALMALAFFGIVAVLIETLGKRLIVVNTSPSVTPGLYIRSWELPQVGSLVDFRIPARLQPYIQMRTGQRGEQWYILKPIIAGPGDHVDTTGDQLRINGKAIAAITTHDSADRPLPVWRANHVLQSDEYFVFSSRIPNSLDSRHYGPIHHRDIDAIRRCILTWGG